MIDPSKIGASIANLRKSKNITQMELAAIVNMTDQAVAKWERGESLPDLESVAALSRLFKISIDDLVNGKYAESEIPLERGVPENVGFIWQEALAIMKDTLSSQSFDTWLKNTSALIDNGHVIITCPNKFVADWISARYLSLIKDTLATIPGFTYSDIYIRSIES